MADYREEQLTGKKWVRSDGFVGANIYQQLPTLKFTEEIRREIGDGTVTVMGYGSGLAADMTTPDKAIVLRNPLTDEILPAGFEIPKTYTGVHIIMYSLYRQLAIERDASGIIPHEYPKNPMMGMMR